MQGGAWMKKEKLRKQVLHLVCTRATQNGSFSTLLPPTPRAYVPREKILAKNCFIGFLDQLVSLFSSLYTAAPLPNSTDYNYFRDERRLELDWGAQSVMERDEVKIAFIFFPKSLCDLLQNSNKCRTSLLLKLMLLATSYLVQSFFVNLYNIFYNLSFLQTKFVVSFWFIRCMHKAMLVSSPPRRHLQSHIVPCKSPSNAE